MRGCDFRHRRSDDGFTLIELLVVIIIIGILAAIAIPVFLYSQRQAYEASDEVRPASRCSGRMEIFYTENFTYVGSPARYRPPCAGNDHHRQQAERWGPVRRSRSPSNQHASPSWPFGWERILPEGGDSEARQDWYYDSTGGGITKTSCSAKTYPCLGLEP